MRAGAAAPDELRRYLDGLAALGGLVSAVEAIVATPEAILFRHAAGFRVGGEPLRAATGARFDAASLTKLWAATLALVLDGRAGEVRQLGEKRGERQGERPRLHLGEKLEGSVVGAGSDAGRGLVVAGAQDASATLEDLLRHRAGFRAWTFLPVRLGKRLGDRDALVRYLVKSERTGGEGAAVYSDLDYVLWGLLVEKQLGRPWRDLLDELVCAPLGIGAVAAATRANDPATAVECRLDNGKEVELAKAQGLALSLSRSFLSGVPQDGNARALTSAGIEAAHAGLFVTADQMLALAREWLAPGRLLSPSAVSYALSGRENGSYAVGWHGWSEGGSGAALSPSSFGHTGFTGGSVWVDPERARIHVVLAHRLASSVDVTEVRRVLHGLAAKI